MPCLALCPVLTAEMIDVTYAPVKDKVVSSVLPCFSYSSHPTLLEVS